MARKDSLGRKIGYTRKRWTDGSSGFGSATGYHSSLSGVGWKNGVLVMWNTDALSEIMGVPQAILEDLAKEAMKIAKQTAPILTTGRLDRPGHESGHLRDSIGWAPWKDGGAYVFTATGGDGPNDKGYGAIVELGSKNRGIPPSNFLRRAVDAAILGAGYL